MPQLNRRRFLQSVSAAGLIPALPVAAASPVAHSSAQLAWASLYATRNNACSVPQIASALGVDPAVAKSLMRAMVKGDVLSAPNVAGVCVPRNPFQMTVSRPVLVTATPSRAIKIDLADVLEDDEIQDETFDDEVDAT